MGIKLAGENTNLIFSITVLDGFASLNKSCLLNFISHLRLYQFVMLHNSSPSFDTSDLLFCSCTEILEMLLCQVSWYHSLAS